MNHIIVHYGDGKINTVLAFEKEMSKEVHPFTTQWSWIHLLEAIKCLILKSHQKPWFNKTTPDNWHWNLTVLYETWYNVFYALIYCHYILRYYEMIVVYDAKMWKITMWNSTTMLFIVMIQYKIHFEKRNLKKNSILCWCESNEVHLNINLKWKNVNFTVQFTQRLDVASATLNAGVLSGRKKQNMLTYRLLFVEPERCW